MSKAVEEVHPTSGFTNLEEILNAITHGIGILLGIAALVLTVVFASMRADPWLIVACSIYGTTLVLLFTASTFYHALRYIPAKRVFMIMDHCAIYLLIAGTYTPFLLGPLRGPLGWTFLGIIWTIAIVGVVWETISKSRGGLRSSLIYLFMGWLFVAVVYQLYSAISLFGFSMLLSGGVVYSIGVYFYLKKFLPFSHVIWHIFVIAGSGFKFFAVLSLSTN